MKVLLFCCVFFNSILFCYSVTLFVGKIHYNDWLVCWSGILHPAPQTLLLGKHPLGEEECPQSQYLWPGYAVKQTWTVGSALYTPLYSMCWSSHTTCFLAEFPLLMATRSRWNCWTAAKVDRSHRSILPRPWMKEARRTGCPRHSSWLFSPGHRIISVKLLFLAVFPYTVWWSTLLVENSPHCLLQLLSSIYLVLFFFFLLIFCQFSGDFFLQLFWYLCSFSLSFSASSVTLHALLKCFVFQECVLLYKRCWKGHFWTYWHTFFLVFSFGILFIQQSLFFIFKRCEKSCLWTVW